MHIYTHINKHNNIHIHTHIHNIYIHTNVLQNLNPVFILGMRWVGGSASLEHAFSDFRPPGTLPLPSLAPALPSRFSHPHCLPAAPIVRKQIWLVAGVGFWVLPNGLKCPYPPKALCVPFRIVPNTDYSNTSKSTSSTDIAPVQILFLLLLRGCRTCPLQTEMIRRYTSSWYMRLRHVREGDDAREDGVASALTVKRWKHRRYYYIGKGSSVISNMRPRSKTISIDGTTHHPWGNSDD